MATVSDIQITLYSIHNTHIQFEHTTQYTHTTTQTHHAPRRRPAAQMALATTRPGRQTKIPPTVTLVHTTLSTLHGELTGVFSTHYSTLEALAGRTPRRAGHATKAALQRGIDQPLCQPRHARSPPAHLALQT